MALACVCVWNGNVLPVVFNLYSACISPYPLVFFSIPLCPCVYLHLHPAILQQIHCIPLYLTVTVSSCIHTFLAVSGCVSPYPTASNLEQTQMGYGYDMDMAKNTLQGRATINVTYHIGNTQTTQRHKQAQTTHNSARQLAARNCTAPHSDAHTHDTHSTPAATNRARAGLLANSGCFVSKCVLWCFVVFCGCL